MDSKRQGDGARAQDDSKDKRSLRLAAERIGALAFWAAVWLVAASVVDNSILLAGPGETLAALASRLVDASFWAAVARSGSMIVGTCVVSAVAGCILGLLAAHFTLVERLAAPVVQVMKSAPVACVVVILLVVLGSRGAIAAIVAFVALPPFYVAALEAHENRPRDAERVLRMLGLSRVSVFLAVTWPSCLPLFRAAAKTSVALSWRAGVTGELLGIPLGSIGAAVYVSKLTLDTAGLLAWTIVIMACGWVCERVAVALLDLTAKSPRLAVRLAHVPQPQPQPPVLLRLEDVSKSFAGQCVLDAVDLAIASGDRVCLMAPTGSGKTTLLRIALGLETADAGAVECACRCAPVLQQATLVESLSAWDNIALTAEGLAGACVRSGMAAAHVDASSACAGRAFDGAPVTFAGGGRVSGGVRTTCADGGMTSADVEQMRAELEELLPPDTLDKPACELSGGTRRLVEIARAVYAPGEVIVLDEPFAGLDDATRAKACAFICRYLGEREHERERAARPSRTVSSALASRPSRALVVATHNREDASLLGARVMRLE